jgi:hypothetical protein
MKKLVLLVEFRETKEQAHPVPLYVHQMQSPFNNLCVKIFLENMFFSMPVEGRGLSGISLSCHEVGKAIEKVNLGRSTWVFTLSGIGAILVEKICLMVSFVLLIF